MAGVSGDGARWFGCEAARTRVFYLSLLSDGPLRGISSAHEKAQTLSTPGNTRVVYLMRVRGSFLERQRLLVAKRTAVAFASDGWIYSRAVE